MTDPEDAAARREIAPVLVYDASDLPQPDMELYRSAWIGATHRRTVTAPPRDAASVRVPAGSFLKIVSVDGPQVGDLNLFADDNLDERFFSGKTRALHGTHVTEGDRLWSCLPYLRPMATIVEDTLRWYGTDHYGGRVHDVIGTRCDPYTGRLLGGDDYHHCCHSNLTRGLADATGLSPTEAEPHVHDVLNVFMCTGFDAAGRYFMKASPVRPGDHLLLFAEIDLLAVLSACPGGDCASGHSSDAAQCHPIDLEVWEGGDLGDWTPPEVSSYDRSHGR
ncbi:urea carboxylase-associated family protein [Pelagovum pacificum]|uniref:DUF1989 domain-containing protein n=1 Tax=Pelagovum pacificum TaxID=2588711 RepID=A0A5C5GBP7_9RHOB|nr:DUF1989 domain-containing protein [Pelagovum pacificum]QQA42434.1 DUF1989 domain-containing protein [Pelagovum pacificum]TNY31517.1 DUF1989 domain-containing protein [Pelagovum pacificum]